MLFSKRKSIPVRRRVLDVFRGYNHNLRIADGEFYDMKNMTGDFFPLLSPRAARRKLSNPSPVQGMACQDGLCFVMDGQLHYHGSDGQAHIADLSLSEGKKQLIPFGSYLIILPDKLYFNTKEPSDCGSIEEEFALSDFRPADVTYSLCDQEGEVYDAAESDTAPKDPQDGQYWLDTASYRADYTATLKRYSKALSCWEAVTPTYVKVEVRGIGSRFAVGDCVTFGGDDVKPLGFLRGFTETAHAIVAKESDWLVVCYPIAKSTWTVWDTESFTVTRKMPAMDFCFEHENRLWGCRYGKANNGAFVNEIYASKLGDFKNWNSFQGISTDSYVASCGTDGKWTGAIRAMGHPLFFKENCLHKVYGSFPAEYQLQTIPCRGVQEGCGDSLAVVQEVLFYKSRGGICAYDGSLPVGVSEALGSGERYFDAVAGGCGSKYYISMRNGDGAWSLFCFDTQKGFWHREDALHAEALCTVGDTLYCIEAGKPELRILTGSGGAPLEECVAWYVETGALGMDSPDRQTLSRITVRMSMPPGASVRFFAAYDSGGDWQPLGAVAGGRLNSFSVSLRPRRCDHLRLRIEGEGEAKIYALTTTTEQGSELR